MLRSHKLFKFQTWHFELTCCQQLASASPRTWRTEIERVVVQGGLYANLLDFLRPIEVKLQPKLKPKVVFAAFHIDLLNSQSIQVIGNKRT